MVELLQCVCVCMCVKERACMCVCMCMCKCVYVCVSVHSLCSLCSILHIDSSYSPFSTCLPYLCVTNPLIISQVSPSTPRSGACRIREVVQDPSP